MKNTKQINPIRIFKASKYIKDKYKEDLTSIIDKYKEKGFRDALIIKDSISWNDDNTINLDIFLTQGDRYKFGNINF